jgi:hypothetical protein
LVRACRQDDRDPGKDAQVVVVGGLPGGQGPGDSTSGEGEAVGELPGGHGVVLGGEPLLVGSRGAVAGPLFLPGSVRLGLAGAGAVATGTGSALGG